jgi:general secretion pathway protein G
MNKQLKKRRFSLIEIIIVVTIMSLIGALVMPRILGKSDDAKAKLTLSTLNDLAGNLEIYKLNTGKLPQSMNDLVQDPGVKGWKQVSVALPVDSWNNPVSYETASNLYGFILKSNGSDGQLGTQDDITFPEAP